jgi:hypothetical protein
MYVKKEDSGRKQTRAAAIKAMEQSLKMMNPIRRSLDYVPTKEYFWQNLSHVNDSDRDYIETSIDNWKSAYSYFGWTGLFAGPEEKPQPYAEIPVEIRRTPTNWTPVNWNRSINAWPRCMMRPANTK